MNQRAIASRSVAAIGLLLAAPLSAPCGESPGDAPGIELKHDYEAGRMAVLISGQLAVVYRYGEGVDLPHYVIYSPSGELMTVEHPDRFPHHRSVWFGDKVRLDGQRAVSTYNALYSRIDKDDPESPFRDRVRHDEFATESVDGSGATTGARLTWVMDQDKPVLDETRSVRIVALGGGEYLLDITFTVTASHGDVAFVSDATHYAWPYVRMTPAFCVDSGGRMVNSEGGIDQKGTHGQVATWVDYCNTVEGITEGLAVFSHTDNEHPHRWLTRDYGCFGPRRIDARSGKEFTLKRGESLTRRVGILVHRGDVEAGDVAARYEQYVKGELGND